MRLLYPEEHQRSLSASWQVRTLLSDLSDSTNNTKDARRSRFDGWNADRFGDLQLAWRGSSGDRISWRSLAALVAGGNVVVGWCVDSATDVVALADLVVVLLIKAPRALRSWEALFP